MVYRLTVIAIILFGLSIGLLFRLHETFTNCSNVQSMQTEYDLFVGCLHRSNCQLTADNIRRMNFLHDRIDYCQQRGTP